MSDQTLHYRPALTVAAITGTVTVATAPDGRQQETRTSDVVLATEADPKQRWHIELKERHFGADREFDLKLSPDERLAGVTSTSTGIGAELLAAGIRVAALASTVVRGLREPEPQRVEGVDEKFAADQPELAARREQYRLIVKQLDTELQHLAAQVGQISAERDTHMNTVQAALTAASAELATIEAAFTRWLEENYPPWTRNYSYLIGTDDLPMRPDAAQKTKFDDLGEAAAQAAKTIGVVVARLADKVSQEHQPREEEQSSMLWFRFPRRLTLAVYESVDPNDPAGDYRLRKIVPAWVVDRHSTLGHVEIESHLFHNNGATIEFGDSGTLVHLANSETSAAGALATTLAGAGESITGAMEQGTKIATALKPKAADPDLRALQDQVTHKELQARLVKANRVIAGGTTTPAGQENNA